MNTGQGTAGGIRELMASLPCLHGLPYLLSLNFNWAHSSGPR